jgi:hypothetical protein
MTPQERDLITHLLERLKGSAGQPKDPEAEGLIRAAMAGQPDAPYLLVQTVLIQDMALTNAQHRIAELEKQLAAAGQPTSFLGGLFGRTAPAAAPSSGPWSRPAPVQPQWQAPSQPMTPQPMMSQPMMAQAMPMMASGSGFLRQAATTAAGIAGGALLFEGIQSLFGQHAGGILSNASWQPGLGETVINNYYGTDPGAATQTAWDSGAGGVDRQAVDDPAASGTDYASVTDDAAGQDVASDQDFGNDDFGGSDTDLV